MSNIKQKVLTWKSRLSLKRAVAIEVIILMVGGALVLPGGEDLYRFYLPIAQGEHGYNPWFASWILFPIQFVPIRYLWAVWVMFTGVTVFWASEHLHINSTFVLLAFPTMGQVWLGQTDAILMLGLLLALLAPSPYLRGFGLLLAAIKPQVTAPAILVLLWCDQARWKTLIAPAIVLLLSLGVWGIDWPVRWWLSRDIYAPLPVWGYAAVFPYGLAAFLAIFLVKDVRRKVTAALLATALGVPAFGIYSHVVFMIFISPWWALPLSYAWVVAYPWYGNTALRFAGVLPLGLLIYLLWPVLKDHWPKIKARFSHSDAILQRNSDQL